MPMADIAINTLKGKLRGTFTIYREGEEPYSIDPIQITSKKEFSEFKRWIDNMIDLLEKTAMEQDRESDWGDYSLWRVEKEYKILPERLNKFNKDKLNDHRI